MAKARTAGWQNCCDIAKIIWPPALRDAFIQGNKENQEVFALVYPSPKADLVVLFFKVMDNLK